jgi:uncharacterized protein
MFVKLFEIEDGAVLEGEIDASRLKRAEDEDFDFLSPIACELVVKKYENGARVKGSIQCSLSLKCGRCLDDFSFPVRAALDVDLVRKAPVLDTELELTGDEMDVYHFEGDEIELDPLVYEEVLLNIPMQPLCRDECRGLCNICGVNRNVEECRCGAVSTTLLADELKTFLTRQGDEHGSSKKKNFSVKKG